MNKIKYFEQQNNGACSARNLGYINSSGEFLAFLDCDDIYVSNKVERYLSLFEIDQKLGLVYSPEYLIDGNGIIVGLHRDRNAKGGFIHNALLKKNIIGSSTPIMKRDVIKKIGLWDENIFTTADWEYWLRISANIKFGFIDEPLSMSRITSSYNSKNILKYLDESFYIFNKYKNEYNFANINIAHAEVFNMVHKYYSQNGDYKNARKFLNQAIRTFPFTLKYYYFYFNLAKSSLKKIK